MKKIVFGITVIVLTAACNNGNNSTSEKDLKKSDTTQTGNASAETAGMSNTSDAKAGRSIQGMVSQYLQMKNALVNDNGNDAASAGKAFVESMAKIDTTSLSVGERKSWNDISDDAKEMAEHIGKNAGKIAHQREHFDMLSKDMYDMVKAFGSGQTLYQDFCPMFNDNKGATWLSETKEIKNPYLGKKMPTCGSVKEEINK